MEGGVGLVRRLVRAQFSRWGHLPVEPVVPGGWDHRTFRLGRKMAVRLPSAARYAAQVDREQRWLPWLAARLSLEIPAPLARGEPGEGYPWPWSIYRWIEGDTAAPEADLDRLALDLAAFLAALQGLDPRGGPPPGPDNFHRGGPLETYDAETRRALTPEAAPDWEEALEARWHRPAVWLHGDVSASNLLMRDGRLSAVLDFGCMAVGDPACDLAIAWTLFSGRSRAAFREALGPDEATWARGRGWALWKALITGDERVVGEVLTG